MGYWEIQRGGSYASKYQVIKTKGFFINSEIRIYKKNVQIEK